MSATPVILSYIIILVSDKGFTDPTYTFFRNTFVKIANDENIKINTSLRGLLNIH